MTLATSGTTAAEELPHWESAPDDLPAAIREIKAALRARIEASGRSVREVFGVIEARVRARAGEIAADKARGAEVWPVIDYADIEAGAVRAEDLGQAAPARLPGRARPLRPRAGARVGSGDPDYVERNRFFEDYRGPADDFFGSVGSRPGDLPGLLVAAADAGPPERPDGQRPGVPQRAVDQRIRRRPVVRSGPRLALPRPHPPPAGGRELGRARPPPGPGHPGPVDDPGLPARVPPPVRRDGRAVRPVGRRPPHGRSAVRRARPCARRSGRSRAGPRCRTWTTTRACCTRCRSPRRWAT